MQKLINCLKKLGDRMIEIQDRIQEIIPSRGDMGSNPIR